MHPEFIQLLETSLGVDRAAALVAALDQPPVVSVRMNVAKNVAEESVGLDLPVEGPVPWCQAGYYLREKPSFTLDPLFHAGCYYVQEASSMAIEKMLLHWPPTEGATSSRVRILDLCAAPGGKSTHGINLMQHLVELGRISDFLWVANEVIASRATILADNLVRWGDPRAVVTRNDPSDFSALQNFFDVVLVDAPCSGEGMFRKDPATRSEWTPDSPAFCAARQRRILEDIWPSLRPGGVMIYSTCTFNRQENEDNVDFIAKTLGAVPLLSEHYYPGEQRGEGFFLAILQKEGALPVTQVHLRKSDLRWPLYRDRLPYAWSMTTVPVVLRSKDGLIKAIPQIWDEEIAYLENRLRVLRSGTALGRWKGKDWIPEYDYALSLGFDPDTCPTAEVTLDEALTYLRGGSLNLAVHPKGYLALTYHGHPLGFVKNLGNRCNNLYPTHLRIRKL